MANANTNSTQQAQDAQHLDNLTSLQQGGEQGGNAVGARADASVNTTTPNNPDNPSLFNDANPANNNKGDLTAKGNDSVLTPSAFANDGREGDANDSPTISSDTARADAGKGSGNENPATIQQPQPDIRGNTENLEQQVAAEAAPAPQVAPTTNLQTRPNTIPAVETGTEPTVTADGVDDEDLPFTPIVRTPELSIWKDGLVEDGTLDSANDVVQYTVTMQNTGNQSLTKLTLTDTKILGVDTTSTSDDIAGTTATFKVGAYVNGVFLQDGEYDDEGVLVSGTGVTVEGLIGTGGLITLDPAFALLPGQALQLVYDYDVTQMDLDANTDLLNTAIADSFQTDPNLADNNGAKDGVATYTIEVAGSPELSIWKDGLVEDGTLDSANDVVQYTVTMQNTGNQSLTKLTLTDTKILGVDTTSTSDDIAGTTATFKVGAYVNGVFLQDGEYDDEGVLVSGTGVTVEGLIGTGGLITLDPAFALLPGQALQLVYDYDVTQMDLDGYVGSMAAINLATSADDAAQIVSDDGMVTLSAFVMEDGEKSEATFTLSANGTGVNGNTLNTTNNSEEFVRIAFAENSPSNLDAVKITIIGANGDQGEGIRYVLIYADGTQSEPIDLPVAPETKTSDDVTLSIPVDSPISAIEFSSLGNNIKLLGIEYNLEVTDARLTNVAIADSFQTDPNLADNNGAKDGVATYTIEVAGSPELSIWKDGLVEDGTLDSANDVVQYTVTMQNTGNQSLTKLTLTDTKILGVDTTSTSDDIAGTTATFKVGAYVNGVFLQDGEYDDEGVLVSGTGVTVEGLIGTGGLITLDPAFALLPGQALQLVYDYDVTQMDLDGYVGSMAAINLATSADDAAQIVSDDGMVTLSAFVMEDGEKSEATFTLSANGTGVNGNTLNTTNNSEEFVRIAFAENSPSNLDAVKITIIGANGDQGEGIRYVLIYADGTQSEPIDLPVAPETKTSDDVTLSIPVDSPISAIEFSSLGNNIKLLGIEYNLEVTDARLTNVAIADSFQTDPNLADNNGAKDGVATYTIEVAGSPELSIWKDGLVEDGTLDSANDVVQYTVTMQNTGNQSLTKLTLTDTKILGVDTTSTSDDIAGTTATFKVGAYVNGVFLQDGEYDDEGVLVSGTGVTVEGLIGTGGLITLDPAFALLPGQALQLVYDYDVTQMDLDANTDLLNTAIADSFQTDPNLADNNGAKDGVATYTITVLDKPGIMVTKAGEVRDGNNSNTLWIDSDQDSVEYTVTINNTGNLTLTDFSLTDTKISDGKYQLVLGKVTGEDFIPDNSELSYSVSVEDGGISIDGNVQLPPGYALQMVYTYDVLPSDLSSGVGANHSSHNLSVLHPGVYSGTGELLSEGNVVGLLYAYTDTNTSEPYSYSQDGTEAKSIFVNIDDTKAKFIDFGRASNGGAVGVGAGVMSGSRSGTHDHLHFAYSNQTVASSSVSFTNATAVEIAFDVTIYSKASSNAIGNEKYSLAITENGAYAPDTPPEFSLRSIGDDGDVIHTFLLGDAINPIDYSQDGKSGAASFEDVNGVVTISWFSTLHGQSQAIVYTISMALTDANETIQNLDFWVVGSTNENTENSNAQIKVVDLSFSPTYFDLVNTVSVDTLQTDPFVTSYRTETVDYTFDGSLDAPKINSIEEDNSKNPGKLKFTEPTIFGTAEPGKRILIFADEPSDNEAPKIVGDGYSNGDGNFQIKLALSTEGDYTITAKAIDLQGNSSELSLGYNLTIDLTAPNAHIHGLSSNNMDKGGGAKPNVAKAGDTLTTTFDVDSDVSEVSVKIGGRNASVTNNHNGTYTATYKVAKEDHRMSTDVEVDLIDFAGNQKIIRDQATVSVDTEAKNANMTGSEVASSNKNGKDVAKAGDTLRVEFAMEDGDQVTGVTIGGRTADFKSLGDGKWEAAYVVQSGDHKLGNKVVVGSKDTAGNTQDTELNQATVSVDTEAKNANMTGSEVASSNKNGKDVAKAGDTLRVEFAMEDGDQVTGVTIGGRTADFKSLGDGKWEAAYVVQSGDHKLGNKVVVGSKDTAGNTQDTELNQATVSVDTENPYKPTLSVDLLKTSNHGTAVGIKVDYANMEVDDLITLTQSGSTLYSYKVTSNDVLNSNHSVTIFVDKSLLSNRNENNFSAVINDKAGNISDAITLSIDLDNKVTITSFTSDTGAIGDYLTADTTLTIAGKALSGSMVSIYNEAGQLLGKTDRAVNNSKNWSINLPEATEGLHQYYAVASDQYGEYYTSSYSVTIDITPSNVVAAITTMSPDNGSSSTDFITNVASQTVSGTFTGALGNGEKIQVSANGTTWIDASVNGSNWTADSVTLVSGTNTLSVRTLDAAGNITAGTGKAYTLDATAPTAVATVAGLSNDSNIVGDFITNSTAAQTVNGTFTGALGNGEKIQVSANGTTWIDASVNGSNWTADSVTLVSGTNTLSVRTLDAAGNITAGTGKAYTLDATAPTAVATVAGLSNDSNIVGDFITNSTAAQTVNGTFTGALGNGEKIQVSANGTTWIDASVNGSNWTADSVTLVSGTNTLSVRTLDAAGNITAGTGKAYTLDATAPTAVATVAGLSNDSNIVGDFITNSTAAQTVNGTFTGALGNGEKIQVSANGTTWIDASVNGSNWTADSVTLVSGTNTLSVRTLDAAGNITAGTGKAYTLDATAPNIGSISYLTSSNFNKNSSTDVRITFNEAVYGFDNSDINVANNFKLSTLITTDNKIYTGTLTYLPNGNTTVTNSTVVFKGGASYTDLAGNLTSIAAPVALDLDGNGISYRSQDASIAFDYNNDGIAESTAWVAPEDGLLAQLKSDGTHNIVFSTQAGETDLQGLAKVYDSNNDGVLDSSDTAFSQFGVWQDANSDGLVQNGEFLTLADRGIASLSLTSDGQVHFEANGDVIVYGQTTYTTSDGDLHIAEDVGFAVSNVYEPLDIAAIIANADAIESVTHIDQLAETASSSSLMVELGGQTYEIATLAGQELGTQDILSKFVGGDTGTSLLANKSWTDVIDISSDHGGPSSITAAGGTLSDGSYANGEGDWTVIINSGDAKVDTAHNQITFASESAENSVTIVTADGASHNIDNVDKIQWHG